MVAASEVVAAQSKSKFIRPDNPCRNPDNFLMEPSDGIWTQPPRMEFGVEYMFLAGGVRLQ